MSVVSCYSPTKRYPKSPKKSSIGSARDEESQLQIVTEAQRSQSYHSRYDDASHREQYDDENPLRSQSQPSSLVNRHHLGREPDQGLNAANAVSDTPHTTITSFMAQMDEQAQFKRSRRSSLGPAALKLVPEEDEEAIPTDRAFIESRREKKMLEMMASSSTTPTRSRHPCVGEDDDTPPYAARVHYKKRSPKKGLRVGMPSHIRMRSKKFNLRFRSQSTSEGGPPVNKALDNRRSKTSNLLPGAEDGIPAMPQAPSSSATQQTRFSDQSKSSNAASLSQHNHGISTVSLDSSSTPPPPPAKDTPPHLKKLNLELAARGMPVFERSGEHGISETETGGLDAEKKAPAEHEAAEKMQMRTGPAALAQVVGKAPSIYSMRASIAGQSPCDIKPAPPGRGQQQSSTVRVRAPNGEVYDYSPSVYSVQSQTPGTCESDNFIRFPKHSALAPIKGPSDRSHCVQETPVKHTSASVSVKKPQDCTHCNQNTPAKAKIARTRTAPHIMENTHQDSTHVTNRDQSDGNKSPGREAPDSSNNQNTPNLHTPKNVASNHQTAPSFGLTPFLSQFERNPHASPMSFQVQSAVPSPLSLQSMHARPDPFLEMITGFHVLHFHIDQANEASQTTTRQAQDEIFAYVANKVDDIKSVMEEQDANLRRSMDAVEQNVDRSADELEKVKKAIDTFNVNLDEQVMRPMKMLADKNDEVCNRLRKLDETMQRIESKLEDVVKTTSSPTAPLSDTRTNPCSPVLGRQHHEGLPGYPRWGGYDSARQMVMSNHGGGQMAYTQVGQSYYNGGDSVQPPNNQNVHYNTGQGHGRGHNNATGGRNGANAVNRRH